MAANKIGFENLFFSGTRFLTAQLFAVNHFNAHTQCEQCIDAGSGAHRPNFCWCSFGRRSDFRFFRLGKFDFHLESDSLFSCTDRRPSSHLGSQLWLPKYFLWHRKELATTWLERHPMRSAISFAFYRTVALCSFAIPSTRNDCVAKSNCVTNSRQIHSNVDEWSSGALCRTKFIWPQSHRARTHFDILSHLIL